MPTFFDKPENREIVGKKIRDLIKGEKRELLVVSPYLSKIEGWDTEKMLGQIKKVMIICDLNSSGCDPYLTERLSKVRNSNIQIKTRPDIHAKVYISSKKIITGSANFTRNGVGPTNIEVISSIAQKKDIEHGRKWFCKLWEDLSSRDVRNLKESEWKRLKANWDKRPKKRTTKVHFVDKLLTDDYHDLFFTFWTDSGVLGDKKVKKVIREGDINMPSENWSFWEEGSVKATDTEQKSEMMREIQQLVNKNKHKTCVNIRFATDKGGKYSKFFRQGVFCSYIIPFTKDVRHGRDDVVICSFYDKIDQKECTFSISGKKTSEFVKWLNESLNKNTEAWCKFTKTGLGEYGYCDVGTLKNVLLKGII